MTSASTTVPDPAAERSPRSQHRLVDSVVALVLVAVLGLPSVAASANNIAGGPALAVAGAASLAMPAALAWRRTRPVRSVVVVYLGALVHFAAGALLVPADLLVLVALYSI
ncbi:hypothetical protein PU560_06160, partial [Georgenia sp. 10Sc9-8]|nr:hypothetical protein [Georgenia halotolerans]